jgi:hypothetical protein
MRLQCWRNPATRWAGREAPRCFWRVATLLLIGTLLASAAPVPHAQAQIQTSWPAEASVTVYGVGSATAPADAATVQILLGLGDRQFGFSSDESGGQSFESAGTRVSADDSDDSDGRRRDRRSAPDEITAEQVDAITAAVAQAAGVEASAVQSNLSPLAPRREQSRSRNVRLDLVVSQPTPEGLSALLATASDAAAEQGLVVEIAGVRYDPADCAIIEEEAERAAITHAEDRAERLARLLGVTLGGVVAASGNIFDVYYGLAQEGDPGCSGQTGSAYDSQYGGLGITVPVFDPSAPAEVTVATQLTIAYAIVEEGEE